MEPNLSERTHHQVHQEEEFRLPYHWLIKRDTRKGAVYFVYWQRARDIAGDLAGKRVLDIGCGDGFFESLLADKGARVVGIDYSERAIAFARLMEPRAEFITASALQLPFPDNSFDIVYSIETFEHIPVPDRPRAVAEIHRVLKPGGQCIITSPSVLLPYNIKHEEHFTQEKFKNTFAPPLHMVRVEGLNRIGPRVIFFWGLTRLFRNTFWVVPSLMRLWAGKLYPRFFGASPLAHAQRYLGLFEKQ